MQPTPASADKRAYESFASFYEETYGEVYRTVLGAYGSSSEHDTKDAVAEGYARAWHRWGKVCKHPNQVGWVVMAAKRVLLSNHRRHGRDEQTEPELLEQRAEHRPTICGPDDVVFERYFRQALEQLSAQEREVFALRHVGGWPMKEIAARLGVPQSTVTGLWNRAVSKLDRILTEEGGET